LSRSLLIAITNVVAVLTNADDNLLLSFGRIERKLNSGYSLLHQFFTPLVVIIVLNVVCLCFLQKLAL